MYQVLDNDMPADCYNFPKLKGYGWTVSKYEFFSFALVYAERWLGAQYMLPPNWDGSKFDYSGYGDTIEIRKVEG